LWRLQSGREPGELEEGKLKVVRIGIHGGKKQERSEALSCSSAVARSHTFLLAPLRAPTAPSMPDVVDSMLDYAVWCFPHASPALTTGAGKRQTGPKDRSKSLIRLRKIGAGEGIRTLDPNLGKVISRNSFGADGGTRTRTLREKQIFLPLRLSPPPSAFVAWTVPSPWPLGRRRRPSSLYTFPQSRAWLGIGLGLEPVSVPRL
jgi:hypothetical protein